MGIRDRKNAVDFIVGEEMQEVGDLENLERLYNELLTKDWFMTFPDFEDYCRTKEQALADYENLSLIHISRRRQRSQ